LRIELPKYKKHKHVTHIVLRDMNTRAIYFAIATSDSNTLSNILDEMPFLVNRDYPVIFDHTVNPLFHTIYLTTLNMYGLDVFDTIFNYDVNVLKPSKTAIFENSICPLDYMLYCMCKYSYTINDHTMLAKYKYMILKILLKGNGKTRTYIVHDNEKIYNLYHDCCQIVNHLLYEPSIDLKHSRFIHLVSMPNIAAQRGAVIQSIRKFVKCNAEEGKQKMNKLLKHLCATYSKL
jgi:hypothetical protein